MKFLIVGLALFLASISTAPAQSGLTFCDLVRNPDKYKGQEVTVRATYHYGFEWQELYCLNCLDKGKAWLEFADNLDKASEKALKRLPKYAGFVNVTVHGVFYSGGHYGHQSGYPHKFFATDISNVIVVVKGEAMTNKKKAEVSRSACGGTDPR